MTTGIISSTDESEVIDLEEELVDFTADVLALKTYESSLRRLFDSPSGIWSELETLLEGNRQAVNKIATLQSNCQGVLRVTWLNPPNLDMGYCLVLFYVESLGWNSLAVYNKARLA